MRLDLVAVSVGRPAVLGVRQGRRVMSGIAKSPVGGTAVDLGPTNLDGDGQADLENHGGVDKAVYAYPAEHLPVWEAELGRPFGPGGVGENLLVRGALEPDVRIGDVWAWGGARLQVSQPREPCYKLQMHTGHEEIRSRMHDTGRTGWYLRVLEPASALPVTGPIDVVERHGDCVTVLDVHRAFRDRSTPEDELRRLLACSALAEVWQTFFTSRLAG